MTRRRDGTRRLEAIARDVRRRAWAPYSRFRVGAAVLAGSAIHRGCNVENASYGLTLCAERAALVQAVAAGEREFTEIVIWSDRPRVLMPCGACRQVLAEFGLELRVSCHSDGAEPVEARLADLLPSAVGPADLE